MIAIGQQSTRRDALRKRRSRANGQSEGALCVYGTSWPVFNLAQHAQRRAGLMQRPWGEPKRARKSAAAAECPCACCALKFDARSSDAGSSHSSASSLELDSQRDTPQVAVCKMLQIPCSLLLSPRGGARLSCGHCQRSAMNCEPGEIHFRVPAVAGNQLGLRRLAECPRFVQCFAVERVPAS